MELNLYNNSKKIMKTKLKFLSLFLILAIAFVACRPDDPDDGGDLPAPDARLNYQGIWKCSEIGGQSYNVNISLDTTTESQIKLYNFHHQGFDEKVNAVVAGTSLSIFPQTMCQGTINIEGTATMQSNKTTMSFYYTVNDGIDLDTVQATYTKQSL